MKASFTASALALLAATNHVDAFAPAPSMLRTATVQHQQQQAKFSSLQLFDKPVDKNEMEMEMEMMQMQMPPKSSSTDPTPFFVSLFQNALNNNKDNHANHLQMATAAMAFGLMLLPLPSNAAMSGGRMGGSFSAPRSRSMSAPRGGGGYGGGGRSSYGGGGGYSRGYNSRPNVIVAPMIGGGGYGYGGGGYYGGAGAISYNRGPDLFSLLLLGGFFFAATNVMSGGGQVTTDGGERSLFGGSSNTMSSLGAGTSVVQLSVAIQVPDRDDPNSILGALNRLSKTARTDSRVGIANLTSQVALEILRRKSSIVSASGNTKHFGDRTKAQREYQSRSIQERSKFETESVSKYGGVDYSSNDNNNGKSGSLLSSDKATMAVITLVLAIDGDSTKVPDMLNSMSDVEQALQRIASDTKVDDCLQSAEILWTPEDRSETLTLRDVVADYPELRSV